MSWRRIALIAIIIVVIAAGVFFFLNRGGGPTTEDTATVESNSVTVPTELDVVISDGILEPLKQAYLNVTQPSEVAELFVEEGDLVSRGDPLVLLETTDQEIAFEQAQAGLSQAMANMATAQAALEATQAGKRQAELAVEAADVQLALLESGVKAEQVTIAERGVDAAQAGISAASGNQSLVLEGAPQAQILAAEADLEAAQAARKRLQDAVNQASGDEKSRLEDQLIAATARVNAAQAGLAEAQQGATQAERLAAGAAVSQAIAKRDAADAKLALVQAGAREEQRQIAQVAVQQAEASLAEAELAVTQAESGVTAAAASLAQAQTAVDAAQSALDERTLTAPISGTVAKIALDIGEIASPGSPLVTLADFSGWQVKTTDLDENAVVAVAVGYPVKVALDALPGEDLSGTVVDIAPISNVVNNDVYYVVTIQLDDPGDLPLRWGMTTQVDIDVNQE